MKKTIVGKMEMSMEKHQDKNKIIKRIRLIVEHCGFFAEPSQKGKSLRKLLRNLTEPSRNLAEPSQNLAEPSQHGKSLRNQYGPCGTFAEPSRNLPSKGNP